MALVRLAREKTPTEVVQRLVETITNPEEIEEAYEILPWNESGLVTDACTILCYLAPATASIALSPCLEALKKANPLSALSLTRALFYFVFERCPLPQERTFQDLTDAQKMVLTTLVACDQAWQFNANMASILSTEGLPQ